MSPSVFLRKRALRSGGVRWHVRYRLGGREAREQHDSTWETRKLAEARRGFILTSLAAGNGIPPVVPLVDPTATVALALDDYAASRIDVSDGRRKTFRQVARHLGPLATMDPDQVTPGDVRAWIGRLHALGRARQTISMHRIVLRAVLDHAGVHPNPVEHRSVRLPPRPRGDTIVIPSTPEFHAILAAVTPRHQLTLRILEGTGLRIGELEALTWGDVDLTRGRLLVRGTKTRASVRWVPLTQGLADAIAATCPQEDRDATRPVVQANHQTVRGALRRACRDAGTVAYSPHDLRHRYISLLVAAGVPITIIKPIVGHARGSTTIDIYSHILIDEDPARLAALRAAAVHLVADSARPVRPHNTPDSQETQEMPAHSRIHHSMEDTGIGDPGA